ncbi:uncharacterized protein LOC114288014 [Camellia sinensis]|uniref:uncharacterized protein LOC114288014 n=1 Tax=Camellia sinensis TaxID=4442 RepID=UPI0010365891|nr:uncharacterized protein LOC114288014 [Camellia sinensis]
MVKIFEMLHINDSELRVTLASYYLKGDASQWWKYAKGRVGPIGETFVITFQDKYLPPTVRERLRQEFQNLKQRNLYVAEFEAAFTSLSWFAPELVATEERCCIEFEKRLRTKILFKVSRNMIWNYDCLVEAVTHVEIIVQVDEERLRGLRSKGQKSQGDFRLSKKHRSTTSSQPQSQQTSATFRLPSVSSRRSAQGNFTCFECGQQGHKVNACPRKGGGQ